MTRRITLALLLVVVSACTAAQLRTVNDYVNKACEVIVGERVEALEAQGFGPAELLKAADIAQKACRVKMVVAGQAAATGALPEREQ